MFTGFTDGTGQQSQIDDTFNRVGHIGRPDHIGTVDDRRTAAGDRHGRRAPQGCLTGLQRPPVPPAAETVKVKLSEIDGSDSVEIIAGDI